MAGERQHFLPRFLLKGFASRQSRQQFYTWVFQKGKEAFETNILNVGLAKNFYTHGVEVDADANITAKEDSLSDYVEYLRHCPCNTRIEPAQSAALVTNVVLRTRSLRQAFRNPTAYLLDSLLSKLAAPGMLQTLVKNYAKTHSQEVMVKLLASPEFSMLTSLQKDVLQEFAAQIIPKMVNIRSKMLSAQLGPFLDAALHKLNSRLPDVIKESHIKALIRDNATSIREAAMGNLSWFVFVSATDKFILGDVGPVCKNSQTNRYLLLASPEDTDEIFCPISDTHLIIGSKEKHIDIDVHEINVASASCSGEFFVSSSNSIYLKHYSEILSSHAQLISERDLDGIVADIIEGR